MSNILSKIFVILSLLINFSCAKSIAKIFPERPINELKKQNDPLHSEEASPEFKQGWRDGCEVGMATAGNTFYQVFYESNKADGYKMMASSDYRTAWTAAFWYCHRVDFIKMQSSIWGSIFGGYR